MALASAYATSRLGRRAGVAALVILVAVGLSHVRDWYGSLVEQEWRGAVQYVEREKQPEDQILVHPDWLGLAAPVTYYTEVPPDTGPLSGDRAWVITLADRAAEIEQLAAASKYEVADRVNFVSVEVWRVVRSKGG